MLESKYLNNEKGTALIISLVFLGVTMLIAAVVNQQAISEIIFSRTEARQKMVFAMAEAGCRDAVRWITLQTAPPETGLTKINGNNAFYVTNNGGTNTYSWGPAPASGWGSYAYATRADGTQVIRYYPSSNSGWTPYVYRDSFRYRYYIESLPYVISSSTATSNSVKVGGKYDQSGGNNYKMYRITSVGSTSDNSVMKSIELNYAVKF